MTNWPVRDILVVNSYITPDSLFSCHVSRVKALGDTSTYHINDATVEIYNHATGELLATLSHYGGGWYKAASTRPQVQTPYRLEVSAPGYPTASGVTSIPIAATPDSAMIAFEAGDEWVGSIDAYDELRFSITDHDPEKNYYEIGLGKYYWRKFDWIEGRWSGDPLKLDDSVLVMSEYLVEYYNFTNSDPVLVNEDLQRYKPYAVVFSDAIFAGGTHHFKVRANLYLGSGYRFFNLYTLSRELYLYRRSLFQHKHEQGISAPDGFGDLSTISIKGNAVDVYSNITGGYGIFAGYNYRIRYAPYFVDRVFIYHEDPVYGRITVDDYYNYFLYFNSDSIQIEKPL